MSDVRVAVLGVGMMGADHVDRIMSRISGATVTVVNADATVLGERIDITRDRAVAAAADFALLAVEHHLGVEKAHVGMPGLRHGGVVR